MSAATDLVLDNFKWRIESITPTNTRPGKKFRWTDSEDVDSESSAGIVRTFNVVWEFDGGDDEPTDVSERVCEHTYVLEINYPKEYKLRDRQKIILQDMHDIKKTLRNDELFNGVSNASSAQDTGLWSRLCVKGELIKTDYSWKLRQEWRCIIREAE